MDEQRLLIYADTSSGVGAGHFVRCVALAEAWNDLGCRAELLTDTIPGPFRQPGSNDRLVIRAIGPGEIESRLAERIREARPAWTVLDSYRLTPRAMAELAGDCSRLAVLRDHGMATPPADVVVDQNAGADPEWYADAGAVVLAGSRYALLRRSFERSRTRSPGNEAGLVMAGGAPSRPVVDLIARVVNDLGDRPIDLVGDGFDDIALPPTVRRLGALSDPAEAMAGRPWALAPAGSTVWELCCLGVPAILFAAAPNQQRVGRVVDDLGAATYLGPLDRCTSAAVIEAVCLLAHDEPRRQEMKRRASRLVDGLGAHRVATELRAATIELEDVTLDHAGLLFDWTNDPFVRSASFSTAPISWDEHTAWMQRQLADPSAWMYVGRMSGEPLGQIRFDRLDRDRVRVGVSLGAAARGRRLAAPFIVAGTREVLGQSGAHAAIAEVKPENQRSAAAFVTAGFELIDESPAVLTYERRAG